MSGGTKDACCSEQGTQPYSEQVSTIHETLSGTYLLTRIYLITDYIGTFEIVNNKNVMEMHLKWAICGGWGVKYLSNQPGDPEKV